MQVTDEQRARAAALVRRQAVGLPETAEEGYLAAVEEIEATASISGPYYRCPAEEIDAFPQGIAIGEDSAEWTPEELRKSAYRRLVLADLAEAATSEGGEADA